MPSSPPRLLYVFNDAAFFLSIRLHVARAARAAGYEVHVATPPSDAVGQIEEAGFPHHPISLTRSGKNVLQELRTLGSLWSLYRRLSPDLVEHATIKPALYGSAIARLAGRFAVLNWITGLGHVFTSQEWVAHVGRLVVMRAYRLGLMNPRSVTLFENPDIRDVLVAGGAVPHAQTRVILGSGVDTTAFAAQPEPAGRPVVMLAARLLWSKGVGVFVETARLLHAEGATVDFVLVGAPDPSNPESVSREQLVQWHEEGVVQWWGPRTDMSEVMARCTIFCLPSEYGEGLPRVLIEAAATERALVATDIPGCRQVVREGVNGHLVPPRDPQALARAVASLLENAAARRRMAAAGRDIAVAEFSAERVVSETLAVYGALLAR